MKALYTVVGSGGVDQSTSSEGTFTERSRSTPERQLQVTQSLDVNPKDQCDTQGNQGASSSSFLPLQDQTQAVEPALVRTPQRSSNQLQLMDSFQTPKGNPPPEGRFDHLPGRRDIVPTNLMFDFSPVKPGPHQHDIVAHGSPAPQGPPI